MPKCLIFVTVATVLWVPAAGAMAQSSRANGHAMRANPSAVGLIAVPALAALERRGSVFASAHGAQSLVRAVAPMAPDLDGAAGRAGGGLADVVPSNAGTAPGLAGTSPGLEGANPGKGHEKALGAALAAQSTAQSVEAPRQSLHVVPNCK
jgi:hypothetical protein